jgi:hypothetical protein
VRRLLALVPLAVALAACGGGSKAGTSTAVAPKVLHVAVAAQSHDPKLGHTWTYRVRVTDAASGKPVASRVHIQVTFNGAPIGEVGRHRVRDGVWKETIPATGPNAFPPAAVGQHVVWHVTATAPGYRRGIANYAISVVK